MNFKCTKNNHKDIRVRLVCLEETCKCRLICEYCFVQVQELNKHVKPHQNFVHLNDTLKLVEEFQQLYQSFKIAYNSYKSLLQTLEQYTQYLQNLRTIYDQIYEDYSIIDQGPFSSQQYENVITKIKQFVNIEKQNLKLNHDQKILRYMNNLINFGQEQSVPFQFTNIITQLNKTLFIQRDDLDNFKKTVDI